MALDVNISQTERTVSLITGGLLVLRGLTSRRPSSLLAGLVGGGLLFRGLTGHCYTYEKLGLSTKENYGTELPKQPLAAHVARVIHSDHANAEGASQ